MTNQPELPVQSSRCRMSERQLVKIPRESETLACKCLFNQLHHTTNSRPPDFIWIENFLPKSFTYLLGPHDLRGRAGGFNETGSATPLHIRRENAYRFTYCSKIYVPFAERRPSTPSKNCRIPYNRSACSGRDKRLQYWIH